MSALNHSFTRCNTEADYTEAIRIDASPTAYNNRGFLKRVLDKHAEGIAVMSHA